LQLTATDLEGVASQQLRGEFQLFEDFRRPLVAALRVPGGVAAHHLVKLPPDPVVRRERRLVVLEHVGDVVSAQLAHLFLRHAQQVLIAKAQDLRVTPEAARQQVGDGEGRQALARAALADDRQPLTGLDVQVDAVHQFLMAGPHPQFLDFKQQH
jgi:hypothetical protein